MKACINNLLVLRFILYECMKCFHSQGEWHKQQKQLSKHAAESKYLHVSLEAATNKKNDEKNNHIMMKNIIYLFLVFLFFPLSNIKSSVCIFCKEISHETMEKIGEKKNKNNDHNNEGNKKNVELASS